MASAYTMSRYPFGVFCDDLCMEVDCNACQATPLSRALCGFWSSAGWLGGGSEGLGFGMTLVGKAECMRQGRIMHELSQGGNHWRYQWAMMACAMAFIPWHHVVYLGDVGRVNPAASAGEVRGNNSRITSARLRGRALLECFDALDKVVTRAQRRIETHGYLSGVYLPGETEIHGSGSSALGEPR